MEMDKQISVDIDLRRDYISILRNILTVKGFHLNGRESDEGICLRYHNLLLKHILTKPRKIYLSEEFTCPAEYQLNFDTLKNKIETGADLNPYLSKKAADCDEEDGLLYDWGIYHLHLGEMNSSGVVSRTGPILFAKFEDENAYLIGVYSHGDWYKQEIIGIVHRNWPVIMKEYRLLGIEGLGQKYSDEEYAKIREVAVTPIEPEPGYVYAPMGGGFTTVGSSLKLILRCHAIFNDLKTKEYIIKQNREGIADQINNIAGEKPASLTFASVIYEEVFYVIEKKYGTIVNFI
jgi:hypothetical protein